MGIIMYSEKHIKVELSDNCCILYLSDFAINELKTIVFVNLPECGETVTSNQVFGDIESIKTVSDLIAPVSGTVNEVNEELFDTPEILTSDIWLVKVSDFIVDESILMDERTYKDFVQVG